LNYIKKNHTSYYTEWTKIDQRQVIRSLQRFKWLTQEWYQGNSEKLFCIQCKEGDFLMGKLKWVEKISQDFWSEHLAGWIPID
jgi:hypothetical protein